MSNVVFIIGLPGSGKTYMASRYARQGWTVFDDPTDRQPILQCVEAGRDCCITDPHLCRPGVLERALQTVKGVSPDVQIETLFFENAPDKCLRNVQHRRDCRAVEQMIRHSSRHYHVPDGVQALKVWQPEDALADMDG